MKLHRGPLALLAAGALCASTTVALADSDSRSGQAIDTEAEYTPFEEFTPLASSSPCTGEPSGRTANPFVLPPGYDQTVVAEESDALANSAPGGSEDLWDMNTQNEFGKDAGRYIYRTHEVGAAPNSGDPPRAAGGAQVTVTDLKTGVTKNLAERNDWERFDGIVWTPYGTILAAEETITASAKDPNVPQANGGLVYELYVDPQDPSQLAPNREPQGTATLTDDGTSDVTRDGIRARPALGAKSHEGMRFDKRGFHYGIAETRGQTTTNQSGGIFRFIPDRGNRQGPLASGQLSALQTPDRRYGEGLWRDLDRAAVQVDADREAEQKGANEYERPEDVETGQSTGRDRNNGGHTLYVAITEGAETGVLALDLSSTNRPFAYPYAGPAAGNSSPEFASADNLALDREGNLAITEDNGGAPPAKMQGDDIFIAAPPQGSDDDDDGGKRRQPASTVQRFASIKDCIAEPTGIYFALEGTEEYAEDNPTLIEPELVNDETLFVNRQHAGQNSPVDQLVAIAPVDDEDDDD